MKHIFSKAYSLPKKIPENTCRTLAEVLEEYNLFPCFFFSIPKQGTVATTNKNPRYFQVKHVLTNSIHFSTNLSHILSLACLYCHFCRVW